MIALAVAAPTVDDMRRLMDNYAEKVDVFELRIDALDMPDVNALLRDRPRPVIVTNRPAWEGGWYKGDEETRIGRLLTAVDLGAEYIDCELAAVHRMVGRELGSTRLILSSHDFEAMPDIEKQRRRCVEAGADIAKVVGSAHAIRDALAVLELLGHVESPTIALAMGTKGLLTRLLALRFGGFLTFTAPDRIAGTAPGQMGLTVMREGFRVHELTKDTRVYGCFTLTTAPHTRLITATKALRTAGHNAIVVPIDIHDEDIGQLLPSCRALGFTDFAHALPLTPRSPELPLLEDAIAMWL